MFHGERLLRIATVHVPRLLLLGACLVTSSLLAQTPDDQKKETKKESKAEENPVAAGVAVDSARKSADLPVSWDQTDANRGERVGPYEIRQSAEFGGRLSDFTGSRAMWSTLVNLGTGPRLMEYTLNVHSPNHNGVVFDDLTFTNFGYGGDPNNLSKITAMKGTLYDLNASFRRDQNIFDYNLLANPLNPATSNPNVPILDSPHEFLLTRRMSDVSLRLFPLGQVRFRAGWSRVVNEGTSFSSFHQGTEALLVQPTLNTTDNYSGGVSFRFIPRTSINYDQFYTYFKGDTTAALSSFGLPSFSLAGGIPVNLGVSFNTPAGQPCATPVLGTGFVNPSCNGYFSFNRIDDRTRNSFPTEQFSFQSDYFRQADLSGRLSYTSAEADLPNFNQLFTGLETRTRARVQSELGNSLTHRLALAADFGVTVRVTDKFRIVDSFRYDNFRLPGAFSLLTGTLFGATLTSNPNVFNPATCPPPFTAATCPQHSSSSGPDIIQENFFDFLRQDEKINTFELEYDFTKRITGHVGFRYENREITHNTTDIQVETIFPTQAIARGCPTAAGCTLTVDSPDSVFVPINGYSGLIGFAARPTESFRASFDTEFYSGDNTFTRIAPRHAQTYKVRASYHQPESWWTLGSVVNIHESRNTSADIGNFQHSRSYAFNGSFAPPEGKWGMDLSYDYQDIFSQVNICFVATPATPGALSCGTPFLSGISLYKELVHNVTFSFYARPIKRVNLGAGYTLTGTNGSTLILNPNAPTGPLSYNYHLPLATVEVELSKNLTYKTGWNYYDYNEKSNPGPTLPRDFRGNVFTLSLRYAM